MNPCTVQRLLDVHEAAGLLSALAPAATAKAVTIESVWVKPGRHFNVCYRLDDGGSVDDAVNGNTVRRASLCVVDAAEGARAMRRLERRPGRDRDAGEGAVALVAADLLGQLFPLDYRLDHLGECQDPAVVHDALGDRSVDRCEVVAYRAGMRCQMRYSAGSSARAYGKIAVEREAGRRRRVHRQLSAATQNTRLRVPALLGRVEALGLDLVAAVGGLSLHDTLASAPDATLVAEAARALAQLHAEVPAAADRVHSASDELTLLESWIAWMSGVEPSTALRRAGVFDSLARRLPQTSPTTFAHRDFHDKQLLRDDSCWWLLDVDTACTGDPELDLGNFLAHLFLRGVQWDRVAAHRELETAAELAYGAGAYRDVTRWYRRASLLRLACVYQLRPHWRHVVPALLDEAGLP